MPRRPTPLACSTPTTPAPRELADWKSGVRAAWPSVRVEHVESEGVGDAAEVGATLAVRAFVALADLGVDDVEVQVVHGKTSSDDELIDASVTVMHPTESYDGNRHRFDADVALDHSGSFGYTVRVVPRNAALASVSEMGARRRDPG